MDRIELAMIFEESMYMIQNNSELAHLSEESLKKTKVFNDVLEVSTDNYRRKSNGDNISVIAGTTFDTARDLMANQKAKKKIAVLNFANAYNPGGGVKAGARAQEECLCRCSTLYNSLKKVSETMNFYVQHKMQRLIHPEEPNQPGIIYTPDVAIFRADDYKVLDEPVVVDVITCAAPDLRHHYCDENTMRNIHEDKAKAIFDLAIENDVDVIVLGAFGCGAFKNPPEIVADVYKQVLNNPIKMGGDELKYKNCFENVAFAIRSSNDFESTNYKVFRNAFKSN